MIKMILCSDINGGIGKDNDLLFHIKGDMEFFKEMTINHPVIMGYNTWLSLPKKPLPKRDNYVLYDGKEDNFHLTNYNDVDKQIIPNRGTHLKPDNINDVEAGKDVAEVEKENKKRRKEKEEGTEEQPKIEYTMIYCY